MTGKSLNSIIKLFFVFFSFLFLVFLALPDPEFPAPPAGSVQSLEKADTETVARRAYFTNYERNEVLAHYQEAFTVELLGMKLPTYRLNYPPEEAFQLIRDQTRSTFLEEVVFPFRGSLFVNGFKPSQAKDEVWYKGEHFVQKITVKYVSSPIFLRLIVGLLSLSFLYYLVSQVIQTVKLIKVKTFLGGLRP